MIQFRLPKIESKKGLSPVFKNIKSSAILPSLTYARFESNGTLKISSTDLETSVIHDTGIELDSAFSFCADGKNVGSFISRAIGEDISLSVKSDRVTLESGGFKASFAQGDEGTFPVIPKKQKSLFIVSAVALTAQLKIASKFVSNDDLRPSMGGVYFDYRNKLLNIVSTDAHRLYFNTLSVEAREVSFNFILPVNSVKMIIESFQQDELITVGSEGNIVSFSGIKNTVICRKIEANFPSYTNVIPDNKYEIFVLRKNMKSFLSIANQFVNRSTKQIILHIHNGNIFFTGGDGDFDLEFEYKIPLHGPSDIPNCRFGINAKFLMEALSVNSKDHAVSIKHSGEPHKAMVIDSCLLLMPLMLNE